MNTLGQLSLMASLLAASQVVAYQAVAAEQYVMTSPAAYKSYKTEGSAQESVINSAVVDSYGANWKQYSSFLGVKNAWLWLSSDGAELYWRNSADTLDLMVNFDDPVGTYYPVRVEQCTDSSTIGKKGIQITTSAGSFKEVIRLDFSGHCADAGLQHAWFAPKVGVIKWSHSSIQGPVAFELQHAKVDGMTLPNQQGLELTSQFPSQAVMLNEQDSVEAYITLINHSDETMTIDFNSGQTFDIYLYDDQDQLMTQWSADRMFTQALQSMEIKAGTAERFGGEVALVNQEGQPLDIGTYRLKVEIKGDLSPEGSVFTEVPLSSEAPLHLDKIMTHY